MVLCGVLGANRCGIMFPAAAKGVFEIDVDVHNFQAMAVKGLDMSKNMLKSLVIEIAILLEGQEVSD